MTLTPEQHAQVSTTIKLIAESMGVTYGRAKEVCVEALVKLVPAPPGEAALSLFDSGPSSPCEECKHFAMRHEGDRCAFPGNCPCGGMTWEGQRLTMNEVTGPEPRR